MATRLTYDEKLERLKFYRSEITLEWNLLSNRLNSFITSQSFLVTAYAISMGNSSPILSVYYFTLMFPILVSIVGILTAVRAYPGIDGAIQVIGVWRKKQNSLFLANPTAKFGDEDYGKFDDDMIDFQDKQEMGKAAKRPHLLHSLRDLLTKHPTPAEVHQSIQSGDVDTVDQIHDRSLYFSRFAPKIFLYTWIVLIVLAVFLHFFLYNKVAYAQATAQPLQLFR